MKKIEKTISRDLPLINIYAWHKGYTEGMKEWLGWAYSDALFYVHDGFADIMRLPAEHMSDFKDVVTKKIDENPEWFQREYETFLSQTDKIYAFYDVSEASLEISSKKELLDFYKTYVQHITEVIGPFVTMIWFPIWCENDPTLAEKYNKEMALGIEARKKSEQIFPRGDALIGRLLKILNKELFLDESLLKVISYDELLAYLEQGRVPDQNALKDRTKSFIYSNHGVDFTGSTREEIISTFARQGYEYEILDYSSVQEVKGNTAFRGKVMGRIRVIMQKNLIGEMVEGEVLVASMTTPEYVPAMKKAAAFITDEGGITCHAAIVAREMKKPCVIGTKIATKVFRDGDLVEVDADNGVVRILERA